MTVLPASTEEAVLASLLENVSDAAVAFDPGGRLAVANRAARALFGDVERFFAEARASSEALGHFFSTLDGPERAGAAVRLRVADGTTRSLSLWGEIQGGHTVIVARDVTAQLEVEDELRLLRRMQSLGYMTASVVHDLNNLLTPVLCLGSVLQRQVAQPAHRRHAGDIVSAAERASSLVAQVLAFIRRDTSSPRRVNVADLVVSMGGLVQRVLGDDVGLALEVDTEAGDAHLEPDQLEHILLNLAANARDAMPRGGTLVVRVEGVPAADQDDAPWGHVRLSVVDTGEGIPAALQERVFAPFFTTKGGLGLGLASVRRFVNRNHGTVSVESQPGEGTTVTLLLPRAAPLPITVRPPAHPASQPEACESVMVVDADADVRHGVACVLGAIGYQVREAESAAAALGSGRDVDIVLADVALPDMSGPALAQRFHEEGLRARVIFMSGQTDDCLARHGVVPGKHPLLRKAFTAAALAQHVRDAASERPAEPRVDAQRE
jgi:two-component system, cell cycle sensor histidine kinase and response regulator CckA